MKRLGVLAFWKPTRWFIIHVKGWTLLAFVVCFLTDLFPDAYDITILRPWCYWLYCNLTFQIRWSLWNVILFGVKQINLCLHDMWFCLNTGCYPWRVVIILLKFSKEVIYVTIAKLIMQIMYAYIFWWIHQCSSGPSLISPWYILWPGAGANVFIKISWKLERGSLTFLLSYH